MEPVEAFARLAVASGIGELYATSGVSVQIDSRRETGAPTVVLFSTAGGVAFPRDHKEIYSFQVLTEAPTVSGSRDTARDVFDLLHERTAEVISGVRVLWLRAVTLPQYIGPGPAGRERFLFSCNFNALIVKD